eukprot:13325005-Heterocapsa_arctica.AAC.4
MLVSRNMVALGGGRLNRLLPRAASDSRERRAARVALRLRTHRSQAPTAPTAVRLACPRGCGRQASIDPSMLMCAASTNFRHSFDLRSGAASHPAIPSQNAPDASPRGAGGSAASGSRPQDAQTACRSRHAASIVCRSGTKAASTFLLALPNDGPEAHATICRQPGEGPRRAPRPKDGRLARMSTTTGSWSLRRGQRQRIAAFKTCRAMPGGAQAQI